MDLKYFNLLEQSYKVFSHLIPAYGCNLGCPVVKGITTITAYGDVLGCQYMPISIGNLREQPLAEILKTGVSIKLFGEHLETCPPAMDMDFVNKYLVEKTYGKPFPVPWDKVFTKEDKTKKGFHEKL